jgi:hypothetical protein
LPQFGIREIAQGAQLRYKVVTFPDLQKIESISISVEQNNTCVPWFCEAFAPPELNSSTGRYEAEHIATVPVDTPPGAYILKVLVVAEDGSRQQTATNVDIVAGSQAPVATPPTSEVLPDRDWTDEPPDVSDCSVTPSTIVAGQSATVSMSADHPLGEILVHFEGYRGGTSSVPWLDFEFGPSDSDLFSSSFTVPPDAANGGYRVLCGASTSASGTSRGIGTQTEFSVVGGSSDTAPPSLSGLTITPTSPVAGEMVSFVVTVSDPAGVKDVHFHVYDTESDFNVGLGQSASNGYDMSGPTFSWSRSFEPGTYRLVIGATDNLSNETQNAIDTIFTVR